MNYIVCIEISIEYVNEMQINIKRKNIYAMIGIAILSSKFITSLTKNICKLLFKYCLNIKLYCLMILWIIFCKFIQFVCC
jgi:hypothetical protein